MRDSHKQAPFHRIESWAGIYYRPASLWEVGTYFLVEHHDKDRLCETLQFQKDFLDSQQLKKDDEEQTHLRNKKLHTESAPGPGPGPVRTVLEFAGDPGSNADFDKTPNFDVEMTWEDDVQSDIAFEAGLNNYLKNLPTDDFTEENFDSNDAETDIHNMVDYLGSWKESSKNIDPISNSGPGPDPDPDPDQVPVEGLVPDNLSSETRPNADGLNNAYVRVLHTNGIHHIGMVTCSCHGQDKIPLDLVACRLLPASFVRIRTIFTTQLMDYFRLCNLELKASAYQFYQLIRRLTLPMGSSDIVNLYDEFRRMSRLWRWMKKLKWAGYGHNKQDHLNPPSGSLSIFCPTCPQPAVNLPEDWKLDKNR